MGKLDFGLAMVRARFADKERHPSETSKKESSPKAHSHIEKDPGKRMHLIIGSLLKKPPREKILLPPDKELGPLRSEGGPLKR